MKISADVLNLVDVLNHHFTVTGDTAIGMKYNGWIDGYIEPNKVLGFTIDEMMMLVDATFERGANCQCFVMKDVIVKWTANDPVHNSGPERDLAAVDFAEYQGIGIHVADTHVIGMVTIQERIIPFENMMFDLTTDEREYYRTWVIDLARRLYVTDMRDGNWGFRINDTDFMTPVIFDFSAFEGGSNSY